MLPARALGLRYHSLMPGRQTRIALRWTAVVAGLGAGALALFALYGAALVDRAMADSRSGGTPRVFSAPLVLRDHDPCLAHELRRVLERRGLTVVAGRPGSGEVAVEGGRFLLGPRVAAGHDAGVILVPSPGGLRLRDAAGREISEVWLPAVVIGAAPVAGVVRWPIALDAMSPALLTAVVDIEDRGFLSHTGLSLRGLIRAAGEDLLAAGVRQGGSTITQQLAKTLLLRPARRVSRKILEAWLATLIEYRYDKRTILETYLNRVYFGQDGGLEIHGVEAAAHYYFGRSARDLGIAEAALLAGIIAAPNRFDPSTHPDAARARRAVVIRAMVGEGHLAASDGEHAIQRAISAVPFGVRWPPAAQAVETMLARGTAGDLASTIDIETQSAVAAGCVEGLKRLDERSAPVRALARSGDPLQIAAVVLAADGRVLAIRGSRSGLAGEFNRATGARRPIGSLVKPFTVATALQEGWSADSPLDDAPLAVRVGLQTWSPGNSDGRFRGLVTVRDALALSLNVPMVRLGMAVGVDRVGETLRRVGFAFDAPRPAMLLGSFEATPLDVARAYAVLLAGGRLPAVRWLASGPATSTQALDSGAAGSVRRLLEEVPLRGTAAALAGSISGSLAAKTGTTDERRDSWFVAIRPATVTVIWLGTDGNRETGLYGATGAMAVWRAIDALLPETARGGRFAP